MLSREVCEKCWGDEFGSADRAHWNDPNWGIFCRKNLEVGQILMISRKKPPPAWCPHKLEHAMSAAMSED